MIIERPLGGAEQLTWLLDRHSPLHFAIAARILGNLTEKEVREALDRLCQRHPLLRVGIDLDSRDNPWFRERTYPLPLRVVRRMGEEDWMREIESELVRPFSWQGEPLVRVILVGSVEISELIVICHHTIADGLSGAYFLRDLVRAIADPDEPLAPLPVRPNLEASIAGELQADENNWQFEAKTTNNGIKPETLRLSHRYRPRLLAWSFSTQDSQTLISRCRQAKTTVHGAICAAFLLALARQRDRGAEQLLRCFSPINLRKYLTPAIEEDFGLYIKAEQTAHLLHSQMNLWEIAQTVREQLQSKLSPALLFSDVRDREMLLATRPSPERIHQGFLQENGYDVMVTNLGKLDFDRHFGRLQLQAIYGPSVMVGMEKEIVVGVATHGEQMTFTLTYQSSEISDTEARQLQDLATEFLSI